MCHPAQVSVDAQSVFAVQQAVRVVRRDQSILARRKRGLGAVIGLQIGQIVSRGSQAVVFFASGGERSFDLLM